MISKNKKIYIAGPMRGYEEFNFPAFDKAKELGESLGYQIISPATMDREDLQHIRDLPDLDRQRVYAKRDLDVVFEVDGVAVLPGFEKSTGAMAEYCLAKWLSLPILSGLTFEPFMGKLKYELS